MSFKSLSSSLKFRRFQHNPSQHQSNLYTGEDLAPANHIFENFALPLMMMSLLVTDYRNVDPRFELPQKRKVIIQSLGDQWCIIFSLFKARVCVSVVIVKEQPCVWFKLYRTWYCVYFLFNKLSFSVMKPSLYILYSRSRRISVQLVARYFGPTGAEMPSLVNAGKNFFYLGQKEGVAKKKLLDNHQSHLFYSLLLAGNKPKARWHSILGGQWEE